MDQEIRRAEELEKKTRAEGWQKKRRRRGVKEEERSESQIRHTENKSESTMGGKMSVTEKHREEG